MSTFIAREEPFTCIHCGKSVEPLERGTYRNHCPFCLRSKHVDLHGPGDRESGCQGTMHPIALDQDSKKGWVIIFECETCHKQGRNKAAPDDDLSIIPGPDPL